MNLPTFETWAALFDAADLSESVPLGEWDSILKADASKDETINLLIEEADIFIMSVAPITQEIQFFHHFNKVGGSRIRRDKEYFVALQGFGAKAQPVIIDASAIATPINAKAPSTDKVIQIQDAAEFKDGTPRAKAYKTKAFVIVPPFLAPAAADMESYLPSDVFFRFREYCDEVQKWNTKPSAVIHDSVVTQDDGAEGAGEAQNAGPVAVSSDAGYLFRWLWSAANDQIPPLQSVMVSPNMRNIQAWAASLHAIHLQDTTKTPSNGTDTSDMLKELSTSVQALSQAAQLGLTHQMTQPAAKSKHSFEKFPDAVQQMILFAGSPDSETPLAAPPASLRDLLACKNSTAAKQYLSHVMQKEYKCLCVIPQSLAMAVYQGCFLWDNRATPTNFSIFYLGEPTTRGDSHSKTLMYNMKITEGEGLSQADFDEVTKSTLHFPTSAHELQTQIQNFIGLVSVIFGRNSNLVAQLYTWEAHVQDNFIMYKMGHENSKNFFTQVLYAIDTRVQNFLRSCKDSSSRLQVKDSYLDFDRHQSEIDDGVFFIRTPSLKDSSPSEPSPNKRARTSSGKDNDQAVTNTKLLQQCKLATGENYHQTFLKKGVAQPKQDGKPICLNFHIRGSCTKSCRRSHKPLTQESTKDLIAFCAECRKA